ncbi:MAG: hypothetical protein HY974_02525 [Candidatus Kerfeldbacteria bacterium]|nr:hypothetical protein [Candidatus Kerfeldbacteria bacterium]
MPSDTDVSLFGQPVAWYVEAAEWPLVALSSSLSLLYLASFWLQLSYLDWLQPLVLILQVLVAVVTAYLVGIRQGNNWKQLFVVCCLVGSTAGLVSALWALIHYAGTSLVFTISLIFNFVTEPVWSGLLAAAVSLLTLAFFHLPRWTAGWLELNH